MIFTLEVLPANEGDCMLLHWGEKDKPKLAVIDGGPGRIFEEQLAVRLEEIAGSRPARPLLLDLVMVSHADNDHIIGIKKLMRKIRREVENGDPVGSRFAKARRLWHNAFNDIVGDGIGRYYQELTASYTASVDGGANPQIAQKLGTYFEQKEGLADVDAEHEGEDIAKLLAGHGEGREVRDDHKYLCDRNESLQLNYPFKNAQGNPTLIMHGAANDSVKVEGIQFELFAPAKTEIEALQKEFDKYITDKGLSVESVLAAYADRSAKNLSSIVCRATLAGKTILFTGDARGDHILTGLKAAEALEEGGTLEVDILKVPHHGSERNAKPEFFEAVHAQTYVISANGKDENPDRTTVEWIIDSRDKGDDYEIVFTYPIADLDKRRKEERQKKQKAWSPKKDSLADLLKAKKDEGYGFSVVEGAPYMIHLGDEELD